MRILVGLAVLAFLTGTAPSHAAVKKVVRGKLLKPVTVTGYLCDVFCGTRPQSLDLNDLKKNPEKHTVRCLLMPPCEGSGYGVLVNMGTAEFKNYILKYRFDKKGNVLAVRYLKGLKKKDNVLVTVTGQDDNGVLTGITIKTGTKE